MTIVTLALLLLTGGAFAGIRVPESCFTSPEGKVSWADRLRHSVLLRSTECDQFAALRSNRPIGELTISHATQGYGLSRIQLTIRPDGIARIGPSLEASDNMSVALTPADYAFFRKKLAPLRDYSKTEILDQPHWNSFKDPSRKAIICRSNSDPPQSLNVTWVSPDEARRHYHDASTLEWLSLFDLGCEGPGGPALRMRAQPVIERIYAIDLALQRRSQRR